MYNMFRATQVGPMRQTHDAPQPHPRLMVVEPPTRTYLLLLALPPNSMYNLLGSNDTTIGRNPILVCSGY